MSIHPTFARMLSSRHIAAAALLAMLAGCGYKGPLYMPPPPPPDQSLTQPPTDVQPAQNNSVQGDGAQAIPVQPQSRP